MTFVKGDFIEAAKTLRDFAKTNKALIIKGGFADGTVYDAEGAKKLADLKSRPQLLAEFAGDIKATMSKRVPVQRSADQGRAYDRCAAREAGKGCLISLRLAA